jgi:serine/threonine-protein kinase RsbW
MKKNFKELRIPSVNERLTEVEQFVEEICDVYYITNTYYGNILLAIVEAVKNAMVHGNGNNPEKFVEIQFNSVPNGLCFTVSDEGKGFDHSAIPNPLEVESLEDAGRGIFLIRTLADTVFYNEKGNKVEITFLISSINHDTTLNRISLLSHYFNKQKLLA